MVVLFFCLRGRCVVFLFDLFGFCVGVVVGTTVGVFEGAPDLVPTAAAGLGFFPFLTGSNFGSNSSRGPVFFFSFSPGEMPMWRGGFLAPSAAVVVGFDSDAVLVPTAARGRWFFPFFDRCLLVVVVVVYKKVVVVVVVVVLFVVVVVDVANAVVI